MYCNTRLTPLMIVLVLITALVCPDQTYAQEVFSPFITKTKGGDATYATLTPNIASRLTASTLLMEIPMPDGQDATVQLTEIDLFQNKNQKNSHRTHYHGHVVGQPLSLVSINIVDDQMSGIVSTLKGNTVIQPVSGLTHTITKDSGNRKTNWTCHHPPSDAAHKPHEIIAEAKKRQKSSILDTITLYIEADYALYQLHEESTTNTINYISGVVNEVAAIYRLEQIVLQIADIKVWTTPDSYDHQDAAHALSSYRSHLDGDFDADFAMLLSGRDEGNGGAAFINGLCNKHNAYSYCTVNGTYSEHTTYSWDVHTIAHELGHNLGSLHTHDCVWGPNGDQAIDGCATGGCSAEIPTATGGTIMSYCHQTEAGVNFALGFGKEPGDLIRANIRNCRDHLGYRCINAIALTESGDYSISEIKEGNGANTPSAQHAAWYTFTPSQNGYISVGSCDQGVDTRLTIYSGDCEELTLVADSDDDCFSGSGLFYASLVDSMEVEAHSTYYIHWDDRWSSDGFTMSFEYSAYPVSGDHCTNGVMDGDETGVDCGGADCEPCQASSSCEAVVPAQDTISSSSLYRMSGDLQSHHHVLSTGELTISSEQTATLEAGFTIEAGGSLEIVIESCEHYHQRQSGN